MSKQNRQFVHSTREFPVVVLAADGRLVRPDRGSFDAGGLVWTGLREGAVVLADVPRGYRVAPVRVVAADGRLRAAEPTLIADGWSKLREIAGTDDVAQAAHGLTSRDRAEAKRMMKMIPAIPPETVRVVRLRDDEQFPEDVEVHQCSGHEVCWGEGRLGTVALVRRKRVSRRGGRGRGGRGGRSAAPAAVAQAG